MTFIVTRFGYATTQLMTVDSAGEINYLSNQIEIPIPSLAFNKALRTTNGEIVAVGKTTQIVNLLRVDTACYFRFSATGDTLSTAYWPNDLGNPSIDSEAYDLALMDNGNVLVTCSLIPGVGSILQLEPNGNLLTRIDLPCVFAASGTIPINHEVNLQSYIISISSGTNPNNNINIYRLSNGIVNLLFTLGDDVIRFVYSMINGPEYILLCGSYSYPTGGNVMKLSFNGDVLWTRNQQGSNTCTYINEGFG